MKTSVRIWAAALAALMLLLAVACTGGGVGDDTTDVDTKADPHDTWQETSATTDGSADTKTPDHSEVTEPGTDESGTVGDNTPIPAVGEEIRVISMNLDANENTIRSRAELMMPVLLSYVPDSIGVQEARGSWVSMLNRYLVNEGYTRVGVDAGGYPDATQHYFATYIFYRTDKFNLIDSGTFWLSKTPEEPSIYDSTVDCNRTCTWALLENKETGMRYVHTNCHLDWMNMEVNRIQVEMIREQLERFVSLGYPVFATGDYNCDEGTASYYEMLESDVIVDSKHVAEKTMDLGTYPNYGKYDVTVTKPIDYVFVSKNTNIKEYKVINEKPEGQYFSDHNPLFVQALIGEQAIAPAEEQTPAFASGAELKVEAMGENVATLSFPQAHDKKGNLAYEYILSATVNGKTEELDRISSGILRLSTEETLTTIRGGLISGTTYTFTLTPVSMLGIEGAPLTATLELIASMTPSEMPAPDLFSLSIRDGSPVDVSPHAYPISSKGSPAVGVGDGGEGLIFRKNGNYKVPGFKENYSVLSTGFTMEVYFTTGSDLTTFQSLASNMHAGGFGFDWEGEKLQFSVRTGSSYVGVKAPIEANTTYHAVGVFDPGQKRISLYLNGIFMGDTAVGGSFVKPTDAGAQYLCLGADSDATGNGEYPVEATLYKVNLYSRPAAAEQALWLWQNHRA